MESPSLVDDGQTAGGDAWWITQSPSEDAVLALDSLSLNFSSPSRPAVDQEGDSVEDSFIMLPLDATDGAPVETAVLPAPRTSDGGVVRMNAEELAQLAAEMNAKRRPDVLAPSPRRRSPADVDELSFEPSPARGGASPVRALTPTQPSAPQPPPRYLLFSGSAPRKPRRRRTPAAVAAPSSGRRRARTVSERADADFAGECSSATAATPRRSARVASRSERADETALLDRCLDSLAPDDDAPERPECADGDGDSDDSDVLLSALACKRPRRTVTLRRRLTTCKLGSESPSSGAVDVDGAPPVDKTPVSPETGVDKEKASTSVRKRSQARRLGSSVADTPRSATRRRPSWRAAPLTRAAVPQPTARVFFSTHAQLDSVDALRDVETIDAVVETDIAAATHFVATKVARTVNLLRAVARGVAVVSAGWLRESAVAGRPLETDAFVLRDADAEARFDFCMSETLAKARQSRLLAGYKVHATASVQPPPDELARVVESAGGAWLRTRGPADATTGVLVTCAADRQTSRAVAAARESAVRVVDVDAFLTAILRHSLDHC